MINPFISRLYQGKDHTFSAPGHPGIIASPVKLNKDCTNNVPANTPNKPDILLPMYPKHTQKLTAEEYELGSYNEEPKPQANPHEPIMVPKEQWSWASTVWNVVVIVLCPGCVHCAVGALVCNLLAYVDHKTVDYDRKQIKLQCSFWWSTIIFSFGLLCLIISLILIFGVYKVQNWTTANMPIGIFVKS